MKISISDEKKQVDEQRRLLDEQIADFHRWGLNLTNVSYAQLLQNRFTNVSIELNQSSFIFSDEKRNMKLKK